MGILNRFQTVFRFVVGKLNFHQILKIALFMMQENWSFFYVSHITRAYR